MINDARRGIVNTFSRNVGANQNNESITSDPERKKCNCKVKKVACAVFGVFLFIFSLGVYHDVNAQLDFIVRKPEEKKDDDPDAPADKQIVDMVNKSAVRWGVDVAQAFTVEDVKPLPKEVQE